MNLTALGKVSLGLGSLHSFKGVVGQKEVSGICLGKKENWNVGLCSAYESSSYLL